MPVQGTDAFIFKITGNDPDVFGTGFAVCHANNHTYVLTCAHVIEDIGGPENIKIDGRAARCVCSDPAHQGYDIAVLETELLDVPLWRLQTDPKLERPFAVTGFYRENKQSILRPLKGALGAPAKIDSEKYARRITCWQISVESGHRIQKGYSGSPVYDEPHQQIVGILNQRKGDGEVGQVISIEVISTLWPECPRDLFASGGGLPLLTKNEAPLLNFDDERAAFEKIITGVDTQTRLMVLHGESHNGKSRLIREFTAIAETEKWITHSLDLKAPVDPENYLEIIALQLGGLRHFPSFDQHFYETYPSDQKQQWLNNLTRKFFSDVENYTGASCVLFIDHYEKAGASFVEWLEKVFMQRILYQKPILLVLAGREEPKQLLSNLPGQLRFLLQGVPVEYFQEYVDENQIPAMQPDHVQLLHEAFRGNPGQFVNFLNNRRSNS